MITINDFKKMELKVARITSVDDVENADRLYLLKVDIGNETRQLVAGLKPYYGKEELLNKKVIVVTNLEPAVIRGVESQGMLLAAQNKDRVSLLTVDKDVPEGSVVS